MDNIKTIIITGGAGFIGSHLSESLTEKGFRVICIDNFNNYYDPKIKKENISGLLENKNYKLVICDILDKDELKNIFKYNPADCVIHLAALPGVRPSILDPSRYLNVNIQGTLNILEIMKESGVNDMIFASSSSVYGNNSKVPFSENDPADNHVSPYSYSKRAGELLCNLYCNLYQFNISCLRFFTVYGPRQRPDLAISLFTEKILNNESIKIYGQGNTFRDYTYVKDITSGIYQALLSLHGYNIYNLGESRTIALNEMIEVLESVIGKKANKRYLPKQQGDVDRTWADISKARSELGYNPATGFRDGIELFIKWKLRFMAEEYVSANNYSRPAYRY